MTSLYLDAFSGVSGDMLLGALLDVGASETHLRKEFKKLDLPEVPMEVKRVDRNGIGATQVRFDVPNEHQHRHLSDIRTLIEQSDLSDFVKAQSLAVFEKLAVVEGRIHNQPIEEVHFHEVGAIDSILDIVGIAIALEELGVTEIHASPIPTGRGFVESQHGKIPVPAPATAALLVGIPTYATKVEGELTTPTGAAVVAQWVTQFGPRPVMVVDQIGYGAGQKTFEHPNVLRIFNGTFESQNEADAEASLYEEESVEILETTLDDTPPERLPYVLERLLEVGAMDAFFAPIHMKKGRSGFQLTVLCASAKVAALMAVIFEETTAIGLRVQSSRKVKLPRHEKVLELPEGPVRLKVTTRGETILNIKPEFDDCRALARANQLSLKEVYRRIDAAIESAGQDHFKA